MIPHVLHSSPNKGTKTIFKKFLIVEIYFVLHSSPNKGTKTTLLPYPLSTPSFYIVPRTRGRKLQRFAGKVPQLKQVLHSSPNKGTKTAYSAVVNSLWRFVKFYIVPRTRGRKPFSFFYCLLYLFSVLHSSPNKGTKTCLPNHPFCLVHVVLHSSPNKGTKTSVSVLAKLFRRPQGFT